MECAGDGETSIVRQRFAMSRWLTILLPTLGHRLHRVDIRQLLGSTVC